MEIEMVEQRYDAITQLSSPNNNIENGVRPMPNEEIVLTPPSPICGENVGNGGARVGGTTTRIPGLIYSSVVWITRLPVLVYHYLKLFLPTLPPNLWS